MAKEPRINERIKKPLYLLLSFLLPCVIAILGLAALLIDPFGSHNLGISDGGTYIKSLPFYTRLFLGQEDFLYNLNGLGGNQWASLAWGGFSIGGVLSVFATLETAPVIFTWMSVFSTALCGLTMYILLAYLRGHRLDNLIFSTSYALIGFNVVNCYQMLFFIGPQMLPLMALGLIKLLRGESPLVYILSFAFCTFLNFYFGFMLAVASVVLCLANLYVHKGELGRCKHPIRTYAISSFIGGFLPALMWLPALKAYSGGGRLDQTSAGEFLFSENMPFIQIFSKLFSGANSLNEIVSGLPNIFCGILVVALAVLYFMNKSVPIRRKRAAAIVLVFYLLTFYITAFTLAMHGGTHTNWFPYRYSFVFSFLLIGVAVEQFAYLDETTLRDTKKCGVILLLVALVVFSVRYEFVSGGMVLLDFALLLLMWFAFYVYKTKPDKAPRRVLTLFLLLVVSGNLYANYIVSIHSMQDWELDLGEYQTDTLVYGAFAEAIASTDDTFFRMEIEDPDEESVKTDATKYNYNGISGAGPALRTFIHQQLSKLGVSWFDMRHWYSRGIPAAADSLLGLKYIVTDRDLQTEKGYEDLLQSMGIHVYKNPDMLSTAVLSDAAVADVELGENAFENLNAVWKSMTGGNKDIFTEEDDITFTLHNLQEPRTITSEELKTQAALLEAVEAEDADNGDSQIQKSMTQEAAIENGAYIEYSFIADRDGPIYYFNTQVTNSEGNGSSSPQMKYVGTYKKGDEVVGKIKVNGDYLNKGMFEYTCETMHIAYADSEVLKEYCDILNSRDITFNVDSTTHLSGTFSAKADERILFTLIWDEGWTCYIDGQEVPIEKTWDLFMSVEAPEGSHTYELRFFPAWMNYGLAISGVAFVALVIFMLLWYRKKRQTVLAAAADVSDKAEEPAAIEMPSEANPSVETAEVSDVAESTAVEEPISFEEATS